MQKTVNLNKSITDPKTGKEIENSNLAELLASIISNSNKGNALKMMDWAETLYKGKNLVLDSEDMSFLYSFVDKHEGLTNLSKAPILRELKQHDQ